MGEGPEGLDPATLASLTRIKEAGGLDKFARLDTTCTVIDAFTVFHDFETADLLSARRDDVTPEDERTVSDLMVDQIEFADVIVLNKIDMVSAEQRERVLSLIKKLNHRAKVIESSYGKIEVNEIVNTGMFNLEAAQTGYGWLQDLHAMTLREVNGKKMGEFNHPANECTLLTCRSNAQTGDRGVQCPQLHIRTQTAIPSKKALCSSSRQVHPPASFRRGGG